MQDIRAFASNDTPAESLILPVYLAQVLVADQLLLQSRYCYALAFELVQSFET